MSDGIAAPAGKLARAAPWQARLLLGGLLRLAALLYLALTLATFLARQHWLADLVTHFRPLLLASGAGLCALLALAKRRLWIAAVAVAATVHGAVLLRPVEQPTAGEPGPALRLITYNLFFDSTTFEPALSYLRRQEPDLLVLAEASVPWQGRLDALADLLPYSTRGLPGGRTWDLVVMSRHPVRAFSAETPITDSGRPLPLTALRLVVEVAGRPVVVWAVHPPSPVNAVSWWARNQYLQWLAARAAAEDHSLPVIVAGDFNLTPWSPWHRALLDRSGLLDAAGTSWPEATRRPFGGLPWSLLATPIDRIMVRPGTGVARLEVGPQLGSDHNPVLVDLILGRPRR